MNIELQIPYLKKKSFDCSKANLRDAVTSLTILPKSDPNCWFSAPLASKVDDDIERQ